VAHAVSRVLRVVVEVLEITVIVVTSAVGLALDVSAGQPD